MVGETVPNLNTGFRDEGPGRSSTWCQLLLHFLSLSHALFGLEFHSSTVELMANNTTAPYIHSGLGLFALAYIAALGVVILIWVC